MKYTEKETLALEKAKSYWNSTILSPAYKEWMTTAVKCENYRGGRFFSEAKTFWDYLKPSQSKHKRLSVNLIEGYVNALIGEQLKTKTSVSVRSREIASDPTQYPAPVGLSQEELDQVVLAFNSKLFKTYEECNVVYYEGRGLEDMLVYGMTGSFFDVINGSISYKRVNPLYIVPDLRDESIGFDDSEFVGQLIPMPINKAIRLFPKIKTLVDESSTRSLAHTATSPAHMMLENTSSLASLGNTAFIKMLEWKEWERAYSTLSKNGRHFTTFDEEIAEKFSYDKKNIKSQKTERIHRAFFAGDMLLDYKALDFAQPREQFSIVLSCLAKKSSSDGFYIPKSLVENVLDLQDQFIISLEKATFLSKAKKIAVDPQAIQGVTDKMTPEEVKTEIASPTSVLFVRNPRQNLVDFSHQADIRTHSSLAEEFLRLFDQATGIQREQRGQQTNAESGIAIYRRQIQSITSSIYAFNEFDMFKKKVGKLFLQTLQMQLMGMEDVFYPAHPLNGGYITLNQKSGDKTIRDVNFLPLDIYIEESPYYLSSKDEQMDILLNLLQSPAASLILQSPSLLKKLPIPLDPEIAQEIMAAMSAQQQAQQQAQLQPSTPQQ